MCGGGGGGGGRVCPDFYKLFILAFPVWQLSLQGKESLFLFFNILVLHVCRHLVKSAQQEIYFLISQPKHMLWVLKRTVWLKGYVGHPQHMLIMTDKKIFTIVSRKRLFI